MCPQSLRNATHGNTSDLTDDPDLGFLETPLANGATSMSIITRAFPSRSHAAETQAAISRQPAQHPTSCHHHPAGLPSFLDGIRAIAVLAVMVFHPALPWLPGGFRRRCLRVVRLPITTLLLQECKRTGRIHFGAFYLRRARRLLPALGVVLPWRALCLSSCSPPRCCCSSPRRHRCGPPSTSRTGGTSSATSPTSKQWAARRCFNTSWSLGLEEQFYLDLARRPALSSFVARDEMGFCKIALVGAAASTIWMIILSFAMGMPTDHDPSLLYLAATLTR